MIIQKLSTIIILGQLVSIYKHLAVSYQLVELM